MAMDLLFLPSRSLSLACYQSYSILYNCHRRHLNSDRLRKFTRCIPPHSLSNSGEGEVHLISVTERPDGSHLYRFGSAMEMQIYQEKKKQKAARENLLKKEIEEIKVMDVILENSGVEEKVANQVGNDASTLQTKARPKRKQRREKPKQVDPVKHEAVSVLNNQRQMVKSSDSEIQGDPSKVSTDSEIQENPIKVSTDFDDFIKVENNSALDESSDANGDSKSGAPSIITASEIQENPIKVSADFDDYVKVEDNSTLEESSDSNGDSKNGAPSLNTALKVELVSNVENVNSQVAATEDTGEVLRQTVNSAASVSGLEIEVSDNLVSQESVRDSIDVEVEHLPAYLKGDNENLLEKDMVGHVANADISGEVMLTSSLATSEPIIEKGIVGEEVDEPADKYVIDSIRESEENVPSQTVKEITEGDVKSKIINEIVELPIIREAELQPKREEVVKGEFSIISGAATLPYPSKVARMHILLLHRTGLGSLMELGNGHLKGLVLDSMRNSSWKTVEI